MKILHIVGSMDPKAGGICRGIRDSGTAMIGLGNWIEVVCLDDPSSSFIGIDSFPVHAVGPAKGPWQYSPNLMSWLTDNLPRFDVLIINGLWIYPGYTCWKAIRAIKKIYKNNSPSLFVMPHGMLDPYFQFSPTRKLKAIRNWIYWRLIESKIINGADGVLFTCQEELSVARKTFKPYHPQKEINVGYGILTPPLSSSTMYQAFVKSCPGIKDEPYLLFLSRINEKKGVDLLIKAYATIVEEKLSNNKVLPKLVIAGPGLDSAFGKKMIDLINSYSFLKNLVFFPGMLSGDAKWGALYNCDAFVLPSHQENFGIAVIEALACEKPVLISNKINVMTEIGLGGGSIIAPDTIDGTTYLLKEWLASSLKEQLEMGKKALITFNKYFNVTSTASHFLEAIKN